MAGVGGEVTTSAGEGGLRFRGGEQRAVPINTTSVTSEDGGRGGVLYETDDGGTTDEVMEVLDDDFDDIYGSGLAETPIRGKNVSDNKAAYSVAAIGKDKIEYPDYSPIDWLHCTAIDVAEREYIKANRHSSTSAYVYDLAYKTQGWIIVTLVGVFCALTAAVVDNVTPFLFSLKSGYCGVAFWDSAAVCCESLSVDGECVNWINWSSVIVPHWSPNMQWLFQYVMFVGISMAFAGIIAYIVRELAPYAAGSGIPEVKVIMSGFIIKKNLDFPAFFVRWIGLPLAVASGLTLGKEGPYVHLCSCVGNLVANWFPKYGTNEAKKREIISAAAAAGITVAFGSPVGAVLFSLEEISYYFPAKTLYRTIFCAGVAQLVISLFNPYGNGKMLIFPLNSDFVYQWFELPLFALVAVLMGYVGAFFIHVCVRWCAYRKNTKLGLWPVSEIVFVAFITAVISFNTPFLSGDPIALVQMLFSHCYPNQLPLSTQCQIDSSTLLLVGVAIAATVKLLLLCFTFATKLPCGPFIPALAIGAMFGRIMGVAVQYLFQDNMLCARDGQCILPGVYAMVGAAACLTSVTRMTISLIVIMVEVTGGVEYILPIMIAVIVSKIVSASTGVSGIYDMLINLNEFPFLEQGDEPGFRTLARDLMCSSPIVLVEHGNTVAALEKMTAANPNVDGFPVVSNRSLTSVVGYIGMPELKFVLKSVRNTRGSTDATVVCFSGAVTHEEWESTFVDGRPWLNPSPIQVPATAPFKQIHDLFKKLGLRVILVMEKGRLVGTIDKKDVVVFIHEMEKAHGKKGGKGKKSAGPSHDNNRGDHKRHHVERASAKADLSQLYNTGLGVAVPIVTKEAARMDSGIRYLAGSVTSEFGGDIESGNGKGDPTERSSLLPK